MRILLTFVIATTILNICFFLFLKTSHIFKINQARRKGLYPSQRKPTMDDVKRLLRAGEKYLAIRMYSEIYRLNVHQSEKEVDLLERNLQHHK